MCTYALFLLKLHYVHVQRQVQIYENATITVHDRVVLTNQGSLLFPVLLDFFKQALLDFYMYVWHIQGYLRTINWRLKTYMYIIHVHVCTYCPICYKSLVFT